MKLYQKLNKSSLASEYQKVIQSDLPPVNKQELKYWNDLQNNNKQILEQFRIVKILNDTPKYHSHQRLVGLKKELIKQIKPRFSSEYHKLLDKNDILGALKYAKSHNQKYCDDSELQFSSKELQGLGFLLNPISCIEERSKIANELQNSEIYDSKGHLGDYIKLLNQVKKSLEQYQKLLDKNDIEGALKYANNHNQEYKKYKELQFGEDELDKLKFLLDSSNTIEQRSQVAVILNIDNYHSKDHLGSYIALLNKAKKVLGKIS